MRGSERGIAMLTVMLLLLIMTVLGIAAVTVTGLENRMAGFFRTGEAAVAAADSCEGTAANIIQQTLTPPGVLPAAFLSTAVPPGPVDAATGPILYAEIYGFNLPSPPAAPNTSAENYNDVASSSPNFTLSNLPGFTVNGDIDLLYRHPKPGTAGVTENVYRITCMASNVATGANSTVTSVYACTQNETCIKKF
jgi:Tfp pilus assembly protein PilX